MASYTIQLKDRIELADGTIGFICSKPNNFTYTAGQFGGLFLLNSTEKEAKHKIRSLTLASAPYETDLLFATRFRGSAYKQTLIDSAFGSDLRLNGAFGSFTLHPDTNIPAVFLTGGIGVVPARSIILQATRDKLRQSISLFYANRQPEDAPFLQELQEIAIENSYVNTIPTMTRPPASTSPWAGETGYITQEMLNRYIPDLHAPIYYICGPCAMVKAMRSLLLTNGISDDKIRTEEFSGYA